MAAARNPKMILFSLTVTMVLFGVFIGLSRLHILQRHAYMPSFGWVEPNVDDPANIIDGNCASTTFINGFPIANTRQAMPNNCLKDTNFIAFSMNYAICFAVAALLSVGVTELVKDRL